LGLKKAGPQGALIQIKIRQGWPAASRRPGLSIIRPAPATTFIPHFVGDACTMVLFRTGLIEALDY
jgi:hypothetical protein